jgi:hypothetical protein
LAFFGTLAFSPRIPSISGMWFLVVGSFNGLVSLTLVPVSLNLAAGAAADRPGVGLEKEV